MTNLKKISVVTIFNKGMRFYITTLKSFLYQTYPNTEWIIIDNTGKNLIASKLKKYLQKDSRIRVLINPIELKPQEVLKQSMLNTKGDLIAFLDPMDYWVKDKLSRQMAYMERYKASLSHTSYAFGNDDCYLLKIGCYHSEPELNMLNYNPQKNPVSVSTVMLQKDYMTFDYEKYEEHTEKFDLMSLFLKSGTASLGMSDVLTLCRPLFSKSEQLKLDRIIKDMAANLGSEYITLKTKVLEYHASKAFNIGALKLDPNVCVGHDVVDSLIELQNFKL